eukprot:m.175474 g.175474  ORF g.175474 m.175474 type:complete len:82 (-) comp16548_c0_seq1:19-264(-)
MREINFLPLVLSCFVSLFRPGSIFFFAVLLFFFLKEAGGVCVCVCFVDPFCLTAWIYTLLAQNERSSRLKGNKQTTHLFAS